MFVTENKLRQIISEELEMMINEEQLDEAIPRWLKGLGAAAALGLSHSGDVSRPDQYDKSPDEIGVVSKSDDTNLHAGHKHPKTKSMKDDVKSKKAARAAAKVSNENRLLVQNIMIQMPKSLKDGVSEKTKQRALKIAETDKSEDKVLVKAVNYGINTIIKDWKKSPFKSDADDFFKRGMKDALSEYFKGDVSLQKAIKNADQSSIEYFTRYD